MSNYKNQSDKTGKIIEKNHKEINKRIKSVNRK